MKLNNQRKMAVLGAFNEVKSIRKLYKPFLLSLLVFGLAARSSYGDTFNYSYIFAGNYVDVPAGSSMVVTGSLVGTISGNYVANPSVVSMYINGVQVGVPVEAEEYGGGPNALISVMEDQNDFTFEATDGSVVFEMVDGAAVEFGGEDVNHQDYPALAANWSLTDVSSVAAGGLSITTAGTNVILTWPTNGFGLTLQTSTNLDSSAVWSTVSPGPVVINGQNVSSNSITGTQMFFRLSAIPP